MTNRRRIRSKRRHGAPRSQALSGAAHDDPALRLAQRHARLLVAVDIAEDQWRSAAQDQALAFRRWRSTANGEGRALAAAAFVAALAREERTALVYRTAWEAWCEAVS